MKSAVMGAGYVGLASDAYLAEVGCEWHENVNEKDCFKVKRIYVKPETSPSLQKYHHRAGRWIKAAEVTDGGKAASSIESIDVYPTLESSSPSPRHDSTGNC